MNKVVLTESFANQNEIGNLFSFEEKNKEEFSKMLSDLAEKAFPKVK